MGLTPSTVIRVPNGVKVREEPFGAIVMDYTSFEEGESKLFFIRSKPVAKVLLSADGRTEVAGLITKAFPEGVEEEIRARLLRNLEKLLERGVIEVVQ